MKKNILSTLQKKRFQTLLFTWFDKMGRKHLPWQQNKTPYRVWVSEIMLQQTQVNTVIPYYERFMQQFPDIRTLAKAHIDEVLHLWTGLGYYSRARNLHKTAKIICDAFAGQFPDHLDTIQSLPGIGRSTAGAILSIAFQQSAPILDGNVKRVLTRFQGITEWPGEKKTTDLLWQIAEYFTPKTRTADYSQAMMDLGATICIRSKPLCTQCPLKKYCQAHLLGIEKNLPQKKPKKTLPVKQATFLFMQSNNCILLEKRPVPGIWGGLWSPPQILEHLSSKKIKTLCQKQFRLTAEKIHVQDCFRHTFSHFHLDILPVYISVTSNTSKVMDSEQQIWYNLKKSQNIGLPGPVKKLLNNVRIE